jgi:arabinose-5-phosphate isomerase
MVRPEFLLRTPRSIRPEALAVDAVQLMEKYNISQLPVVDSDKKLVGALNMHDLLKAKVI